MSPITHLFVSWVIAAKTTNNPRDCMFLGLSRCSLGEGGSLKIAVRLGHSFVGVFNRRLDKIFVGVLCRWNDAWQARKTTPKSI
jgi:hypothetical protein